MHPELAGYSPLLAQAALSLPAEHDFVRDGIRSDERRILDWADSRLFGNENFLASKWGPDNWPVAIPGQGGSESKSTLSGAELRLASAQAILLLMLEIDIQNESDGKHVISWEVDSLDRVLDGLNVYSGLCVHCYGKTGYDTRAGVNENYGPLIWEVGHGHREMLKAFAYFAKADGEGILVRGLTQNDADGFGLLHKRGPWNSPIGTGSFNYENVSFMSQIRLPEGRLASYPTMVFEMVGDAGTEREAVENIFDHVRKKLVHFTGDHDDFANIYRPYTVTPYSPELGWVLYTGEAGSQSSAALLTGAFRAIGLKAEQFKTTRSIFNAGSVEVDGETYYYNGNDPMGTDSVGEWIRVCAFFRSLDQVEDREYDLKCDQ